jgi:hypothetical protein
MMQTNDPRRADYDAVARFIEAERGWRERVFAKDAKKLAHKVAECDRALAALRRLYLGPGGSPDAETQPAPGPSGLPARPGLFD